jgi:hypothetical protein
MNLAEYHKLYPSNWVEYLWPLDESEGFLKLALLWYNKRKLHLVWLLIKRFVDDLTLKTRGVRVRKITIVACTGSKNKRISNRILSVNIVNHDPEPLNTITTNALLDAGFEICKHLNCPVYLKCRNLGSSVELMGLSCIAGITEPNLIYCLNL